MKVVYLIDSKHVEKNETLWLPVDAKNRTFCFVFVFILFYTRKPTEQSGII